MEGYTISIRDGIDTLARNRGPIILSLGCLFLLLLFLYLFYILPVVDIGPEQPIAFSHRVHAGVFAIHM
jgi:hypothetical protein